MHCPILSNNLLWLYLADLPGELYLEEFVRKLKQLKKEFLSFYFKTAKRTLIFEKLLIATFFNLTETLQPLYESFY